MDFKNFFNNNDVQSLPESEIIEMLWRFVNSLDETILDQLGDEQLVEYVEIIEAVSEKCSKKHEDDDDDDDDDDEDEDLDDEEKAKFEAMPAKKVRRDVVKKREASREHRKEKAKRKIEGKRKRKTSAFKRYKKKAKRLGKRGLTSTGSRKRTYINK